MQAPRPGGKQYFVTSTGRKVATAVVTRPGNARRCLPACWSRAAPSCDHAVAVLTGARRPSDPGMCREAGQQGPGPLRLVAAAAAGSRDHRRCCGRRGRHAATAFAEPCGRASPQRVPPPAGCVSVAQMGSRWGLNSAGPPACVYVGPPKPATARSWVPWAKWMVHVVVSACVSQPPTPCADESRMRQRDPVCPVLSEGSGDAFLAVGWICGAEESCSWHAGDAALGVALVGGTVRILAQAKRRRVWAAWRGAIVAIVAEREAEEFYRQREKESQQEVLAARFNRLRVLHPVLHSWRAAAAAGAAARAEAAAEAEREEQAREKRMLIAARFHVHCRRHSVLRAWRAALAAARSEREERRRQEQMTSRIDAVLSRVRAAQAAGKMRSSAARAPQPYPQAAATRAASTSGGRPASSPGAKQRAPATVRVPGRPAAAAPGARGGAQGGDGGARGSSIPAGPRRADVVSQKRGLQTGAHAPARGSDRAVGGAAVAPAHTDARTEVHRDRAVGPDGAAEATGANGADRLHAWASVEAACGGLGSTRLAAGVDVDGTVALAKEAAAGDGGGTDDCAAEEYPASNPSGRVDAELELEGYRGTDADVPGPVSPRNGDGFGHQRGGCATPDVHATVPDCGQTRQADQACDSGTRLHMDGHAAALPPSGPTAVQQHEVPGEMQPADGYGDACSDLEYSAADGEVRGEVQAGGADEARAASAAFAGLSKADAVTKSWDAYVEFLKQEVICEPGQHEADPACSSQPAAVPPQPTRSLLPMQKYSQLRGRRAQEELDAQLARVQAARGARAVCLAWLLATHVRVAQQP